MALALAEAGATVYCIDLAEKPSSDFDAAVAYAKTLGSRIKYIKANVCDQKLMNKIAFDIAEEEVRPTSAFVTRELNSDTINSQGHIDVSCRLPSDC